MLEFAPVAKRFPEVKKVDIAAALTIWSYQQPISNDPLAVENDNRRYRGLLLTGAGKLAFLEDDNWAIHHSSPGSDWWLVMPRNHSGKSGSQQSIVLTNSRIISTITGESRTLDKVGSEEADMDVTLSADGRFLVYFSAQSLQYYSYDILTGRTIGLTEGLHNDWTDKASGLVVEDRVPAGRVTWVGGSNHFMVSDKYDYWMIDASGNTPPMCVTKQYGRQHAISFGWMPLTDKEEIREGQEIWLSAYGEKTGENGFFTVNISGNKNPEKLFFEKAHYYRAPAVAVASHRYNFKPIKADRANVYLLCRMGADKAPNYFVTSDFKGFKAMSEVYPEKKYNWMKSRLLSWTLPDGTSGQGALFMPENMDSAKKYPVIVHYYEQVSQVVNSYEDPMLKVADLNVPWFVSHGYMVFMPDIYYNKGNPGLSALRHIHAGTDELVKLPFVDSTRLGLMGHSFGGYETLFMVANSTRYKAALAGAPVADLVSKYNTISKGSLSASTFGYQNFTENKQLRMRATLWESRENYIRNSPIYTADKVTTPLLMMHNREDQAVPFLNGLEFFLSLRRLGKPVWLLSYERGGHGIGGKEDKIDYITRMEQFFNHYLKGARAPLWMLDHGYKGYELDSTGRKPGPSKIVNNQ
jgi:dienelactone hydrolase